MEKARPSAKELALQPLISGNYLPVVGDDERIAYAEGAIPLIKGVLPDTDYSLLSTRRAEIIQSIRQGIDGAPRGSEKYSLYRAILIGKVTAINTINLIKASREEIDENTETNISRLERQIIKSAEISSGSIDKDIFGSILKNRLDVSRQYQAKNPEEEQVIKRFHELAEPHLPNEFKSVEIIPSIDTIKFWGPLIRSKFQPIIDCTPADQKSFDAKQIASIFESARQVCISHYELQSAEAWAVELAKKTNISVDKQSLKIWIPEDYKPINHTVMEQKLVHEMIHFIRNVAGEMSSEPLMGVGLNGGGTFEEGFCILMEMAVSGSIRGSGLHYIASGLYESAGNTTESQRKVFEIMWHIKVIEQMISNEKIDKASTDKAKRNAAKVCSRVFRGWPGIYFGDLKYAQGIISANNYLKQIQKKAEAGEIKEFDQLFLGGYSPINKLHSQVVNETLWPKNITAKLATNI